MKISDRELRRVIRKVLTEATDINRVLYGSLEKAIAGSNFWQEGNTEDDGDYEDVPGLGLIHQTSAAQYLEDLMTKVMRKIGVDIHVDPG